MTSRRSKDKSNPVDQTTTPEANSPAVNLVSPTLAVSDDANGRLALVLASFALAVATFLIIFVAISASNA